MTEIIADHHVELGQFRHGIPPHWLRLGPLSASFKAEGRRNAIALNHCHRRAGTVPR
jgi:hypothetical protein